MKARKSKHLCFLAYIAGGVAIQVGSNTIITQDGIRKFLSLWPSAHVDRAIYDARSAQGCISIPSYMNNLLGNSNKKNAHMQVKNRHIEPLGFIELESPILIGLWPLLYGLKTLPILPGGGAHSSKPKISLSHGIEQSGHTISIQLASLTKAQPRLTRIPFIGTILSLRAHWW